MFEGITKIAVIGSSEYKRASPRVGSIGFLCNTAEYTHTNLALQTPSVRNEVVVSNCVFSRYGFQQKSRMEQQTVLLVTPSLASNQNPVQALNRAVQVLPTIKSNIEGQLSKNLPFIIAAPIIASEDNVSDLALHIALKMQNRRRMSAFFKGIRDAREDTRVRTKVKYSRHKLRDLADTLPTDIMYTLALLTAGTYQRNVHTMLAHLGGNLALYKQLNAFIDNTAFMVSRAEKKEAELYDKMGIKYAAHRGYHNVSLGNDKVFSKPYSYADMTCMFNKWRDKVLKGEYYVGLKGLRIEMLYRAIKMLNKQQ